MKIIAKKHIDFIFDKQWLIVIVFTIFISLLLVINPQSLVLIFPVTSLIVGFFLYFKRPIFYIYFTLFIWYLAPFVSRIVIYKIGGFYPGASSSQTLVASISFITLIRYVPTLLKVKDKNLIPFLLCFGSIVYGCVVGLILLPIENVVGHIGTILGCLAPISLAFHIYMLWPKYPTLSKNLQQTILWLTLIVSTYGVYQFLVAPAWDIALMQISEGTLDSWYGRAEPLGIRVFSTMSSPFACALNLIPGIILSLTSRNKLRFFSLPLGLLAILLSTYRTSWYSLAFSIVLLFFTLRRKSHIKLIFALLLLIILISLFATIEPFSTTLNNRFESFSNLENDDSRLDRMSQLDAVSSLALSSFLGYGIGSDPYLGIFINRPNFSLSGFDMGLPQLLTSLGWIGLTPFLLGLLIIINYLFRNYSIIKHDVILLSSISIIFGSLIRVITSSIILNDYALPLWLFIGLSLSGCKFLNSKPFSSNSRTCLFNYEK